MNAEAARKILVVDGDLSVRETCLELLTKAGYSVEAVANGAGAVEKLRTSFYDLVIADINMEEPGGISLMAQAEKEFPYLKDRFLFLTARSILKADVWSALAHTHNRLLKKPFDPEDLFKNAEPLVRIALKEHLARAYMNKRREARFDWDAECLISGYDPSALRRLTAKAVDISYGGLKVLYVGEPILRSGNRVNVDMESIEINKDAEVVWSKDMLGLVTAGMRFIEPLPLLEQ